MGELGRFSAAGSIGGGVLAGGVAVSALVASAVCAAHFLSGVRGGDYVFGANRRGVFGVCQFGDSGIGGDGQSARAACVASGFWVGGVGLCGGDCGVGVAGFADRGEYCVVSGVGGVGVSVGKKIMSIPVKSR